MLVGLIKKIVFSSGYKPAYRIGHGINRIQNFRIIKKIQIIGYGKSKDVLVEAFGRRLGTVTF